MAQLGTAVEAGDRQVSLIERATEDVRKACGRLSELASMVNGYADAVGGSQDEASNTTDPPRECRSGQMGELQDGCDLLHRRVDSLNEEISNDRSTKPVFFKMIPPRSSKTFSYPMEEDLTSEIKSVNPTFSILTSQSFFSAIELNGR